MKETIKRFGGWLSGRIHPTSGLFISWGLKIYNLRTM